MSSDKTTHVLDNAVWHALNTHHTHFAVTQGLAKRYPAEVAAFAGLTEDTPAAYQDLQQLFAPGEIFAIPGSPSIPPEWTVQHKFNVMQMVCERPVPEPEPSVEIVTLAATDVPDIVHLIKLTEPGPFFPRTIEMGQYLGIRQNNRLVALAGERLYLTGYREISAVCTHPDHQGKGYARQLVARLVNQNWQYGDTPFLHVAPGNTRAIKLYETLHFRLRREVQLAVVSRP
jgi:predicted GNAT family acetyltransferase